MKFTFFRIFLALCLSAPFFITSTSLPEHAALMTVGSGVITVGLTVLQDPGARKHYPEKG